MSRSHIFFFFNDTATTEIYTLSLHDALPICAASSISHCPRALWRNSAWIGPSRTPSAATAASPHADRKSTRLNSSHSQISYAVFCLKKKKECQSLSPITVRTCPNTHQEHYDL